MMIIKLQTEQEAVDFIRQADYLFGYPNSKTSTLTYCNVPEPIITYEKDDEGNDTDVVLEHYYELPITNQLERLLEPEKWEEIDRVEAERIANLPPYVAPEPTPPEPIDEAPLIEARKQVLLLKLVAAIVEVNSIKEAAREIVGSDNEDFINSVAQAEAIKAGSIYLIGQLDTLESAMAFDVREHTVQAMKELFIKFIIQ